MINDADTLAPDARETWLQMTGPMRWALKARLVAIQKFDDSISLAGLVRAYGYQGGRCAGTGLELTPRGVNAVHVFRVDPDVGFTPDNTVLVSRGYRDLRKAVNRFGEAGHRAAVNWLEDALAGAHRRMGDLRDPIEE